ncbi:MAG: 3-hydroxybutyryl-CoA dehydrogenase [Robiginitalea sp.]
MKTIAVIGAGTMGNGIAHVFAQQGFQVHLVDLSEERLRKGLQTIEKNLERMVKKEVIESGVVAQTLANIKSFTEIAEAVGNSGLVIEAATEDANLKKQIFIELDSHCPAETILATNTSSISITEIAAVTTRPEKVIGMHFMNPVPVMKLVEVIRGYSTSDAVTETILELSRKLGKIPTEVNDYPGFIANRILMPMINEAIESLFHGIAGVQEIDTVMKLGMGHPMGPLQLADFIGLDVCLSILEVLYEGFKNPKYAPCPLLVKMVAAGKLGVKSGEGFYDYSQSRKAEQVAAQFL